MHVWGRRGFTRQPENSKREHFRAPSFKNTTKIQRKDTREKKERKKIVAGKGKKDRILGGRAEGVRRRGGGGPAEEGEVLDAPTKILNTPQRHDTTQDNTQDNTTQQHAKTGLALTLVNKFDLVKTELA